MAAPTRTPGPGPWRYGLRVRTITRQQVSPGKAVPQPRETVVQSGIPKRFPEAPLAPPLTTSDNGPPFPNLYDALPPKRQWPADQVWNPPDLIPAVIVNQFDTLPAKAHYSVDTASVNPPDLIANLPPNLFDLPAPKKLAQDELLPNVAANTPPAVVQAITVRGPLTFLPRPPVFNFWEPPQILPYLPFIQPTGPAAAGRHHKRYKVKLDGRTVYFATKAEAYAARERHRAGVILEAEAAGIPLTKVKLRRPPIRAVPDERHPEELKPAAQIAAPDPMEAQRIAALKELRMREEEEIAIALLLLH